MIPRVSRTGLLRVMPQIPQKIRKLPANVWQSVHTSGRVMKVATDSGSWELMGWFEAQLWKNQLKHLSACVSLGIASFADCDGLLVISRAPTLYDPCKPPHVPSFHFMFPLPFKSPLLAKYPIQ